MTTDNADPAPTARQIADWCHPSRNPDRWIDESFCAPEAPTEPTRLLGIWAHPDDEAYLSAGLMAQTVADGGQVTLVAITDGEAGFSDLDPRPVTERAELRRRELRAAMDRIGVHDVRFLGVPDGAVAEAPVGPLVAEIGSIIREVEPDVTVTFGPDGITGHDDHVANSHLVTLAWTDNQIGELWYAAKSHEWLAEWRDLHDAFGVWMTGEPTGVDADEAQWVVDIDGAELDMKRAVLAEHKSQTEGLAAAFGEDRYRQWICQEVFRRPSAAELSGSGVRVEAVAS